MTATIAFRWTVALFGLACAVFGAERLAALRGRTLWARLNADDAVARRQFASAARYRRAKGGAQIVRCLGGLAGFGSFALPLGWVATLLLVLAGVLLYDRQIERLGGDGADQQLRIAGVALAVTAASACVDRAAIPVGVAFLAGQLLCCYGVAGVAKLAAPTWRHGEALRCIAASDAFGTPALRRLVALHPGVALTLSWGVMLFEAAFPICVLHPALALGGLTVALSFHAGVAATMRLNSFLWVFPVSYPAFYWTAGAISRLLTGWFH